MSIEEAIPYLPEKGGIRRRGNSLQVSAAKWHIVDGKKKLVRFYETIKLDLPKNYKKDEYRKAFIEAVDKAKRRKEVLDQQVNTKGIGQIRQDTRVRAVKSLGEAYDDLWDKRYCNQTGISMIKVYAQDLFNYFPRDKKLNSFTVAEVEAFKKHLAPIVSKRANASKTCANSSVNKRLGVLRETLRHALKHRWVKNEDLPNPDVRVNNMGIIDLPRTQGKPKPMLDVEEESKLIQQARDNGDEEFADWLIWNFDTGMRHVGESNMIKVSDIEFNKKSITFFRRKTGVWSTIPLTPRALEVAKRRKANKNILKNGGRLFPYSKGQVRHKWEMTRGMAGLSSELTPYCTRHTCCTRLVEAGLPANVVKDWMGHKSIQTTLTYYAKSSPTLMAKAVKALETYNAKCEPTKGDVISFKKKTSMIGHNSKNRKED